MEKALLEITLIEKEQEKYSELRAITEGELERCKEKAVLLEKVKPDNFYKEQLKKKNSTSF